MTRIEWYILHSKPVQWIFAGLKRTVLPGFEGVSMYAVLSFVAKNFFSAQFNTRAAAVSFSFLTALPPLLLFFFTLIPYLPLPEEKILGTINEILNMVSPNESMKSKITVIISDFFTRKKNVLLSFSVLLTLFYASNGVLGLMIGFDKKIPGFKKRSSFKKRLIAIALTFLIIILVLISISYFIFQAWATNYYKWQWLNNTFTVKLLVFLVLFFTLLFTIAMLYRYGCATLTRLKFISPGAILASILTVIFTAIFFYSVNNLVNYDKVYGSIGTLIVFMLWIHFISQIMLIGFELNAAIITNKYNKSK